MGTERRTRLDRVAIASMVLCCFLWGLNQVAVKATLAEVPPLWQAAIRSLGAAALVFGWARLRGIALFDRDTTLRGGLLAGSLFAAEFGCIFVGLQFTTASRMAVFIYLSPFVVALGMPFIARSERTDAHADAVARGRGGDLRVGLESELLDLQPCLARRASIGKSADLHDEAASVGRGNGGLGFE